MIHLKLHEDTFGITQKALKALRNELADRIDHEIDVRELPSSEMGHCGGFGYAIIDRTMEEVVIIGDGFRHDGQGEGGAGARAALALLSVYGMTWVGQEEPVTFIYDTNWNIVADCLFASYIGEVADGDIANLAASRPRPRSYPPRYINHLVGDNWTHRFERPIRTPEQEVEAAGN